MEDQFAEIETEKDTLTKEKVAAIMKSNIGQAEKTLKDLEEQWKRLDPTDKSAYKKKTTDYRVKYDKQRTQFLQLQY